MGDSWGAIEAAIRLGDARKPAVPMDDAEMHEELTARLAELAEKLHYALEAEAEMKATRENLTAEIERLAGTTNEGQPVKAMDWNIEVAPGERWSWDKDLVAQLLEARGVSKDEDLPDFVDRAATINRKRYEKAPEEERAYFAPALTRKEGKTAVKVWPDDPSKYRKES